MLPNTNPETGVRYGVVALNTLADWVFDEFFHNGTNVSYEAALEEFKQSILAYSVSVSDEEIQDFNDHYEGEEECYELETSVPEGTLKLGLSYLGGAPLVWVFQSPHTTRARLCSPCIPNGGDLDNQDPDGEECYTLPPDWFGTTEG
jgi:hypothetical protein